VSFMYAPLTLGLICALFMPYARQTGQRLRTLIGLARWPRLKDVLYALPAYVVYFGISFTLGIMTQLLDRRYDPSQAQNLGISAPSSSVAYLLTFLMLVILPPLVEEVLFRGFLFGTLRKGFSVVPSSLITSALFGVAHGQFNLFLDTSALSLVLCYLRIKTGSLWAGMLLHAVKNLVAFTVLYVISAK